MSKKKIIIIAIVIIIIAGAAWFFLKKKGSSLEGKLVRAGNDNEVYFIENGVKRLLMSWDIGAKYGLTQANMISVAREIVDSIPMGAPIEG